MPTAPPRGRRRAPVGSQPLPATARPWYHTISAITPRLNLVHAAEVSYVESGFYSLDLSRLQAPGDGYMDDVHPLRDTYGADAVVLLAGLLEHEGA